MSNTMVLKASTDNFIPLEDIIAFSQNSVSVRGILSTHSGYVRSLIKPDVIFKHQRNS